MLFLEDWFMPLPLCRSRNPQIDLSRLRFPVWDLATMPAKYPPALDVKSSGGFAETIARAIAARSRPIVTQASPHNGFDTPRSWRSQSAASTISGQDGEARFR